MCHHPDTNGVRPEVSAKIRTQSGRGRNFHPDIGSKPLEHTSGGAFGGPVLKFLDIKSGLLYRIFMRLTKRLTDSLIVLPV